MAGLRRPFAAKLPGAVLAICLLCSAGISGAQTTGRNAPATRSSSALGSQAASVQEESGGSTGIARSSVQNRSPHRRTAYGPFGPTHRARTYSPRSETASDARLISQPAPPEIISQPPLAEGSQGDLLFEGDSAGDASCECSSAGCGQACHGAGCGCFAPCPVPVFENLEWFGGVHGFTGPANRGQSGSFGFHEGVNWGMPAYFLFGGAVGFQVGFQATQSNFEGTDFTPDNRNQTFLTGGLFRRVDWGLQAGVVVDHMHDEWYYSADLVQLRGELSWVFPWRHEVGFWFAAGTDDQDVWSPIFVANEPVTINETLQGIDLYAFFYRHCFDECGGVEGRLFAGFTGESDGLIGGEFRTALTPWLSLQSDFTYLIPEATAGANTHAEESWNLAIHLVWHPGRRAPNAGNYYRPLFPVASNGTFLVDRLVRP